MSNLKIFTENIEPEALNQIYTLIKQPAFSECKVRIMPDVHAGAGCGHWMWNAYNTNSCRCGDNRFKKP